jgi:hypothetical protein
MHRSRATAEILVASFVKLYAPRMVVVSAISTTPRAAANVGPATEYRIRPRENGVKLRTVRVEVEKSP